MTTGVAQERVVARVHGGPEVLTLVREDLPEPGPGQVRVRVTATGVSYADVGARMGMVHPGGNAKDPRFGAEIVGEVDALGPGVTGVEVGRRVTAPPGVRGAGSGYARYALLPADSLVTVPDGVDPVEVVPLVLNYMTARYMLRRTAKVEAGQTVLVLGGAGGVGSALLDLCREAGVRAIATARPAKQDTVRELDAEPLDQDDPNLVARVRELTGGDGVHAVFDHIGGANTSHSAGALRRGGVVVVYGGFGMQDTPAIKRALAVHALRTFGHIAATRLRPGRTAKFFILNPYVDRQPVAARAELAHLIDLLAQGRLHPVICARLPLAEAARGHALLASREARGKIVLLPGED